MATFHDVAAALADKKQDAAQAWKSRPHAMLDGCEVRLVSMSEQKRWEAGHATDEQKLSDDGTRAGYALAVQLIDADGNMTDAGAAMRVNKMLTPAQAMACVAGLGQVMDVDDLRVTFVTRPDQRGFNSTTARLDFDLPDAAADAKGGR